MWGRNNVDGGLWLVYLSSLHLVEQREKRKCIGEKIRTKEDVLRGKGCWGGARRWSTVVLKSKV